MISTSKPESRRRATLDADVRRLLNCLAEGAAIGRDEKGRFRLDSGLAVSAQSQRAALARKLVESCLAADCLEWQGDRLVLSDTGRARLRRTGIEDDIYRQQHQLRSVAECEIDGTRRPVQVNEAESPLGWLKSRRDRNGRPLISEQQYEAGERLRADYWFAHLSP